MAKSIIKYATANRAMWRAARATCWRTVSWNVDGIHTELLHYPNYQVEYTLPIHCCSGMPEQCGLGCII